ncbi:MAG: response regulator [Candidatus Omnitrophica bacterium]|nr:response regulator [Candidatus Omnitrophota bacterium]
MKIKNKILIVDDETELTELLKLRFGALGYKISSAADGEEALNAVKTDKPDLILLDIMLPKLDGISVLLKLKSDPAFKDIPVFMLSAIAQDEEVRVALSLGAMGYIKKPFDKTELITKVQDALK